MNDHLGVFMLDVGQGDGTVVLLPNNHAVVFDCADDVVLTKHLRHWKVPAIDAFVLSHLDQDHIAGAAHFLKGWTGPVGCVCLSADREISAEHDEAKRAKCLVDYIDEGRRDQDGRSRRWEVIANTRDFRALAEGPGWSVRVIAPEHADASLRRAREGAWEEANRYSSILRIEAGGTAILIGGDAPLISWSLVPAGERSARLLRVPHHGGALDDGGIPAGWDVDRLYREVGAETALVSVGTNNRYGHPREPWIQPISGGACKLLCTQVTGRCHAPLEVVSADGSVKRDVDEVEAQRTRVFAQPDFRHWAEPQWRHLTEKRNMVRKGQLEIPCAGTVAVSLYLDGRVRVAPNGGDHDKLVDTWREPLCRAAG